LASNSTATTGKGSSGWWDTPPTMPLSFKANVVEVQKDQPTQTYMWLRDFANQVELKVSHRESYSGL
jgi:hypothetical protein